MSGLEDDDRNAIAGLQEGVVQRCECGAARPATISDVYGKPDWEGSSLDALAGYRRGLSCRVHDVHWTDDGR